jgi:multiple sugar transport system substrate-binding protein
MRGRNQHLILLVVLTVFTLVGITQPALAKTKINICALQDISTQVALKLLKESDFEERTGITVEANLLEFAPMVQAHKMDFMSGAANYDLVAVDQPSLGLYVTSGWVMPLSEFMADKSLPSLDDDDLIQALLNMAGIWKDKLYAVPMGSYGGLFAFRKDVFAKHGITPPKTFAEFYEYAKKVNDPPKLYGTALFAHKGEYLAADMAPLLWSWGAGYINGSDVDLPGVKKYHAAWDTPEGIAALKYYARFYKEGLTPVDTLNYDHVRFTEAFQVGKVAMALMIGEAVGEPMENPDKSKVAGKMDYTPFPGKKRADGTVTPPMPMIGAHSLAINKDSRNKKEAFLVLQFLTSKAIGKEYILRGGKPFRQSHFFPEAFEKFPSLKAYAGNIPTGKCRPNIPEYPAVSEIFTTAFHRALAQKDADVEKIMKEAAQKANNDILKPSYPDAYK